MVTVIGDLIKLQNIRKVLQISKDLIEIKAVCSEWKKEEIL